MAAWLAHDDPEIRRSAVGRLAAALFWAEPSDRRQGVNEAETAEAAAAARPVVLAAFVRALRWQSGDEPYIGPLLEWLTGLADLPGARADIVEGTRLLMHGSRARPTGGADAAQRTDGLARLDHPSD